MDAAAQSPEEIVFAVDERFDAQAVWKLCGQLWRAGPEASLVVDFSHAVHVLDDALATFADRAPRLCRHLRLRGLSQHHHRLLDQLSRRLHGKALASAD